MGPQIGGSGDRQPNGERRTENGLRSLHLTSPGVLLILAALCSGGIFLLDVCYLQPHVGGQKQAALRELAARAANSGCPSPAAADSASVSNRS